MSLLDAEIVVVVARYSNTFHWFRCDRELWVLDRKKWRQEFIDAGFTVPDDAQSARWGIPVVDKVTQKQFLAKVESFEIDKAELAAELSIYFNDAQSWWDVSELFPIMFADFDRQHVAAFYPHGTRMERYVPDDWTGKFEDFATEYDENRFPLREKFWVQNGLDMLAVLNERGSNLGK